MARKKIVFVIVEGPSDDEALGVIMSRLYAHNSVYVEITHGDITSDYSVTANNIVLKIGNLIRSYAKANHYTAADFQEVIHLIDMDGAYISDKNIIENADAQKPFYTTSAIYIAEPENIKQRNFHKRKNVDRICFLEKVWGKIPYSAYYMSSNLDHVLYDKLNSSNEEKEKDAYCFAKKYKDRLEEFLSFISESDFSVCDDFKESWDFIKKEKHSLERHSNLGICFQKIKEKQK